MEKMKKKLRDMENGMKSSNICLIWFLKSDYMCNGRETIFRDISWEFFMIKKHESSNSRIPVNPKQDK